MSAVGALACGCPGDRTITNPARHAEWHDECSRPAAVNDLIAARALRAAGEAQALGAESVADWRKRADYVLRELARSKRPFTADDLVAGAGLPKASESNANNALGALFAHASKKRTIVPTGNVVPSKRIQGHARTIREWVGR